MHVYVYSDVRILESVPMAHTQHSPWVINPIHLMCLRSPSAVTDLVNMSAGFSLTGMRLISISFCHTVSWSQWYRVRRCRTLVKLADLVANDSAPLLSVYMSVGPVTGSLMLYSNFLAHTAV